MDADVLVVGLGTMGSMALWRLAGRGVKVAGFDRFRPPHTMGSHHGGSRIIRTAYYEGAGYVPLARRSFELWRQLAQESGRDLLVMTGGLHMGPPDSPEFAGALSSAREHGVGHQVLDAGAVRRRFPQHALRPNELGLLEDEAGYLVPEVAIAAALARAAELGAEAHFDTPVEAVEAVAGGVAVRAGGRTWRARHAVVAAGAWNSKLRLPGLGVKLRVVRQSQAWFRAAHPALHHPSHAPVFTRHVGPMVPGTEFAYGFPSLDGRTVKVGVFETVEPVVDPDTVDRTPTPADTAAVSAFVKAGMPDLDPVSEHAAVCLQEFSPDHHFVVEPLREAPSITALVGFSGHGFKFASALGEAAADFATHGGTDLPVGHLSAARFAAGRKT
ncbi:MAG: N-methyl-L-tryptophan oxidase [Chloroflexota bacterium]